MAPVMVFLAAPLLVIGVASLLIGAMTGSPTAFLVAAVASGIAIVFLWRVGGSRRQRTFVSDPPPASTPEWRESTSRTERDKTPDSSIPEVAIDRYDELLASEILISLETLSREQLVDVIKRERSGLARMSVMNRAQMLIDLTDGAEVRAPEMATAQRGGDLVLEADGDHGSLEQKSRRKGVQGPDLSI